MLVLLRSESPVAVSKLVPIYPATHPCIVCYHSYAAYGGGGHFLHTSDLSLFMRSFIGARPEVPIAK
jgi:hypothetical protein